MNLGVLGSVFVLSLLLQQARGLSPEAAGVRLIPLAAPLALVPPLAARAIRRTGPRLPAALGLAGTGTGFLASLATMQDDALVGEFTRQAESFNASEAANARQTLDALVELAAPRPHERWLEAACGPGIVARALAPHAGAVHGVDLTPAMVELARREAAALDNLTFAQGDATSLPDPDAAYDGAIARFTIHHVPLPARLVEELARVVKPQGSVVLADHVADDDPDAAAWSQEIERLRDPSHWASLPLRRLRALGEEAGLTLEAEQLEPLELDLENWLERGSGTAAARPLIERLIAHPPPRAEHFRIAGSRLRLRWWAARFRRGPAAPSPG